MADRERSRSPDRGAPPTDNDQDYPSSVGGDNNAPPASKDGDTGGAPAVSDNNGEGAGSSEEVKLYIGNLDYSTDEHRLREEFSQFGTVTDVFLPVERSTNRPRGFGFVTLATREAAEKAISKTDQSQLDGRTIRVNESRPKGERDGAAGPGGSGSFNSSGKDEVKLYVGNLSFDTPETEIRRIFEEFGTVNDCFMPTDRDTGRVRGFAFVTMPAVEAEKACNAVNGQEVDGRTLRVNEAQPRGAGGGGGGGGYRGGGGGYHDGGYGGGGGYGRGGYDDRGGYGGGRYDDRGGDGYGDRGGYRGGYDDRGGGYRGGGYGGGGYDDGYGRGGGYDRY